MKTADQQPTTVPSTLPTTTLWEYAKATYANPTNTKCRLARHAAKQHILSFRPHLSLKPETPGHKRKDLDATKKLGWIDVAIKVITLVTVTVKLIAVMLHLGL